MSSEIWSKLYLKNGPLFSNIKISYLFSFQDKVSSYLWLISLDISNICALYANLSTIAPVSIASLNISSHLSKVKFVVIIIDPLSFLFDSKLNNISHPSLSKETYPSSSNITKSYFSNFFLYIFNALLLKASRNSIIKLGTDTKSTLLPSIQALMPKPIA